MKVVTLASRYSIGGAQMNALLVAEGLMERGHDSAAWFLMRAGDMAVPSNLPVRVFMSRATRNPLVSILLAIKLLKALVSERPNVVIGFHPLANVLGALVCGLFPRIRFVATQRNPSDSQSRVMGRIEAAIGSTRLYDSNIAVTGAVRDTYDGHPGSYREKMRVVHNAAPPLCENTENSAAFRLRHGLPDGPALGLLGRLAQQKNPTFVLDVLRRLESFHVFFAGSGPLEGDLKRKAAELSLTSRVHFLGELHGADVSGFYKAIDIFLLPSRFEGFGRTLVEAMGSGVPVIANRIPVTEEVVGDSGILVDLIPDLWADEIRGLMADKDRHMKLSRMGLDRAGMFSLASMISGYELAARAAMNRTTPISSI